MIKMMFYKTLYSRHCKSPLHWDDVGASDSLTHMVELEITNRMIEDMRLIKKKIKHTYYRSKKSYTS